MSFLLDTVTCSAHLKNNRRVTARFTQHLGQRHLSVVTVAELLTWACRTGAPLRRRQSVEQLLDDTDLLDVDLAIASKCGELRAGLFDAGRPTETADVLIAAIEHNLTIVTHNTRHYAHIPGVRLTDWIGP